MGKSVARDSANNFTKHGVFKKDNLLHGNKPRGLDAVVLAILLTASEVMIRR